MQQVAEWVGLKTEARVSEVEDPAEASRRNALAQQGHTEYLDKYFEAKQEVDAEGPSGPNS